MGLTIGTQLGSYQVTALLGKGGMGEVYRARDLKLKRDVAIKVLPEEFSRDSARVSRFQREAEVLASLNHPNIAQIYGVEDSTPQTCIVMELVEGETLQERLQRGPLSVDESLPIVKQIAEALEAAHERGVIHRDLKPANIKLSPNGKAKLLDFGLAKALGEPTPMSSSPTLTSGSGEGVLLGTAAYMSPEQAKGKEADCTTDIWAFGCVLFEMLTGRAVFRGETIGEILASVFRDEPEWAQLPASTPESIRRLLRRCLTKDQSRRLHHIADALLEFDDAQNELGSTAFSVPEKSRNWERAAWISAIVVALAVATWALLDRKPVALQQMRLDIEASSDVFAISPDGRKIVYAADDGGRQKLWIRPLDSASALPLAGTEDATFIWWSPDSRTVGFRENQQRLKRIDLETGAITVLGDTPVFRGATSNRQGVVLIGTNTTGPILRLSGSGEATPVTPVAAAQSQSAPYFLPDGQHFLYHVRGGQEPQGVYLAQLGGSETRHLIDAEAAVYAAGQLFFVQQGKLFAQEFDLSRLALKGNPSLIAQQANGQISRVSVSDTGTIVYRRARPNQPAHFVWFDRSGNPIGEPVAEVNSNNGASLSLDGQRLAQPRAGAGGDIWLSNLTTGASSRFTFDPAEDSFPLWSPRGDRIVFSSNRKGTFDLYAKSADTGADEEPLIVSDQSKVATDWSSDERVLLYRTIDPKTRYDIWALPLDGDKKPFPLVQTTSDDLDAQFSPDAKFIAYQSNRSGRYEIYAERFHSPGLWQVSNEGGAQVRWRRDGKELFYLALDGRLMSVPVRSTGETLSVGAPVPLFMTRIGVSVQSTNRQQYFVSADGMRFLIYTRNTQPPGPPVPITILLNWKPK